MKALVIGYGSIGKRHVKNLLSFPDVEVIICTNKTNVKPIKKKCKVYSSLEKCLDQNPDVAIVANVTSLHVRTAMKLARTSIDLFVEKPLSNSTGGIKNLLNLVREKNLVTLMGCNLRFHECIKRIKKIISDGEIGRVLSVQAESGSYLPDWHPYEDYRQSYASRKDLGGGVVLTYIHEIDYLYWFFGEVKEVFSITGKYSELNISVDDLSSILMRFKNGVIAEIHLDYFQRPDFRKCKVIGTKGTIYWDSNENTVKVYDVKKEKWIEKMKLKNYDRNAMYVEEMHHFLQCVNKRIKTINPLNQGAKTLDIALTVMKSSKIKRMLAV